MIGYLFEPARQQRLNADGRNCWDVYFQEIFNQLGVDARAFTTAELSDPEALRPLRALFIGRQSSALLTADAARAIDRWTHAGGLLIGFAADGLDPTFGLERETVLPQADDYTIAAYLQFWPHPLTREIHPFLYIDQKLFALSPVVQAANPTAIELAHLYDTAGRDLRRPAITWRAHGRGQAAYFAFDAAQTIWLLHQGKPLPPLPEGEFARRTPDLQVLGPNSTRIAYADEIVHLLQNMLAETGQPFIYPLPPDDGAIPDAVLYYSGDEYTGPVELSLQASDFMARQGLPYHINIAVEHHPMTVEQLRHIQANGHEVSCYMWIHTADHTGSVLNPARLQVQSDLLLKRFGFRPGAVLIGSTQWCGWAEPARWLAAAGATADNTFFCSKPTPGKMKDTPWFNGPGFGFGYGTGQPFFFYDDAAHGNARIPLVEQPIVCYELGHRGSNPVAVDQRDREMEIDTPEDIHEALDRAVRYHLALNVFYHPVYIVNFPHCRAAIAEIKRYIAYKGARVLHLANNTVADWWQARARSRITDLAADGDGFRFTAHCAWPGGMIVRWPAGDKQNRPLTLDGTPVSGELKREFGRTWRYVVIPAGRHRLEAAAV